MGSTSGQGKFRILGCTFAVVTLQFPPSTVDHVMFVPCTPNGTIAPVGYIRVLASDGGPGGVAGTLTLGLTKVRDGVVELNSATCSVLNRVCRVVSRSRVSTAGRVLS